MFQVKESGQGGKILRAFVLTKIERTLLIGYHDRFIQKGQESSYRACTTSKLNSNMCTMIVCNRAMVQLDLDLD